MFKNYYWFWESEIKEEYLDKWIAEHFDENKVQNATINVDTANQKYDLDESIRKTEIVWVKPATEMFDTIFNYIQTANKSAEWNFDLSGMEDVQLGRYTTGGFYDYHMDTILGTDKPVDMPETRKLSMSLILSDPSEYEGGEFYIQSGSPEQEKLLKMEQLKGRVLAFPSFMIHGVAPVTKGKRESVVVWVEGPKFK